MSETSLIDRTALVREFNDMLSGVSNNRVIRLIGSEKMGKSRLIREYRRIAREEYMAQCALVDLRLKLHDYCDVLFNLIQQVGITYFPNFMLVHDQLSAGIKVEVKSIRQLFSTLNVRNDNFKSTDEFLRRRLTAAFIQDLLSLPSNIQLVFLFDSYEEANTLVQEWINEQLLSGIMKFKNIYIVFSGRSLPEPSIMWQDMTHTIEMQPVVFEDFRDYCSRAGIDLTEEIIRAFHDVFDGKPGLFAEYTSKLISKQS